MIVFFIICWSIKDWIESNDNILNSEEIKNKFHDSLILDSCQLIANGNKHLHITQGNRKHRGKQWKEDTKGPSKGVAEDGTLTQNHHFKDKNGKVHDGF